MTNIKRLVAAIFFFLCVLPIYADERYDALPVCRLRACIIDGVTEYPIVSAKINVADTAGTVLCDSVGYNSYQGYRKAYEHVVFNGSFPLHPKYKITISAKGYESQLFDVTTPADRLIDLGTIAMTFPRRERRLNEITVTSSKIKMVMKGDTLEYDATAFQLQEGSMLDGLIAALPGATLDDNGRITVNGRFVSELLVNGRNFFSGDPNVALRNLPAYTVKNVQVYRKEPEHLRGIENRDRSNDPLVMDVNLKKEYMGGWIANAEGGYGSGLHGGWSSRWMGRLFAMYYNKYSYLAIHSSANNLNDPEAAGSKGQWRKPSATSGEITTKRIGIEYNTDWHDQKYAGVNTKLYLVRQNTFNTVDNLSESYLPGGNTFFRSQSASWRDSWQGTWYGETSRNFETFVKYIWFSAELKYENGKTGSELTSAQSTSMLPDNFVSEGSVDHINNMVYLRQENSMKKEHSISQSYRFSSTYKYNLSLSGHGSIERSSGRLTDSDLIQYIHEPSLNQNILRHDLSPSNHYNYTLMPMWSLYVYGSEPIDFYVEYKFTEEFHRGERSISELRDRSGTDAPSMAQDWTIDYANSYRTSRHTWKNAINPSFSYNWGSGESRDYSVTFSGEAEYQTRLLNDYRNLQNHDLKRNDWRFAAKLSIGKGSSWWGNGYGIEFHLEQRLPDIMQMLDVRDSSNPLVIELGNPNLRKATDYGVSLFYHKNFNNDRQTFSSSLSYLRTDNALARAMTYDRTTGVTVWQPCNINGNQRVDGDFYYGIALLGQKLSINNSLKPRYARSADFSSDSNESIRSTVDNWNIFNSFNANYNVIKGLTISARFNLNWVSLHSRNGLFRTFDYTDANYGIGVEYTVPGGVELDTDIMAYCRRGYEDPTMNSTDWVWNLQLSKTFGRAKQFTVKAIGFDLLQQLPTIKQIVNAQGRTETRYNSQPSYALLTLAYRLDIKPQKKSTH